jgi:hypothetical protein
MPQSRIPMRFLPLIRPPSRRLRSERSQVRILPGAWCGNALGGRPHAGSPRVPRRGSNSRVCDRNGIAGQPPRTHGGQPSILPRPARRLPPLMRLSFTPTHPRSEERRDRHCHGQHPPPLLPSAFETHHHSISADKRHYPAGAAARSRAADPTITPSCGCPGTDNIVPPP